MCWLRLTQTTLLATKLDRIRQDNICRDCPFRAQKLKILHQNKFRFLTKLPLPYLVVKMDWFLRTNILTILTFKPGKSVDYLLDLSTIYKTTFPFQINFQMHLWLLCGKIFCTMNLIKKWSFSVLSDKNFISEEQLTMV